MEVASTMAPQVIYMAACLLTDHPFERNLDMDALRTERLTQKDLLSMKALRRIPSNGYGYLVLADRLLRDYR